MKKNLIVLGLLMFLVSSCIKNKSLTCEGKDKETIDESSLTFHKGFKCRMLNTTVKPDNIATFLGHKVDPRYQGEIGNNYNVRIEGSRIKDTCSKLFYSLVIHKKSYR